jgi:chorismate dehydratase
LVINRQPNSRDALARVFPAFGRPARPIDGPDYEQSISSRQPFLEPGAPPLARALKSMNLGAHVLHSAFAAELARPRLGQISFVNCLPVVLPIERQHVAMDAEIVMETPARLNALFDEGQLELGAMSSYYFLAKGDLTLCPDVSISCLGPVGSVLLFSKIDPAKLANGRIVCSAQSATSINLLKVLFAEQFGRWPEMVAHVRPDLDDDQFDGALVIGDRALEVDNDWSQSYIRIDLGEWWHQRYELPMVFGVWAARPDWVDKNHYRFAELSRALWTAKQMGLTRRWKDTLFEAKRWTGLSLSRLERYYKQELNFDFDVQHGEGLALFQELLLKYDLLL